MATRVHLVRHGEVANPERIVYASLPGYSLSELGALQAKDAARYLGRRPVVSVWSSPLQRALQTAEAIATRLGQPVRVDDTLTEWALMGRWTGVRWDGLDTQFPGELDAYLTDPANLPFSPESLESLGERMAGAVRRLEAAHPHGDVVVVSHSASVRAATLALTGAPLTSYWEVEPPHCSVTTLQPGSSWKVETTWAPLQETTEEA